MTYSQYTIERYYDQRGLCEIYIVECPTYSTTGSKYHHTVNEGVSCMYGHEFEFVITSLSSSSSLAILIIILSLPPLYYRHYILLYTRS